MDLLEKSATYAYTGTAPEPSRPYAGPAPSQGADMLTVQMEFNARVQELIQDAREFGDLVPTDVAIGFGLWIFTTAKQLPRPVSTEIFSDEKGGLVISLQGNLDALRISVAEDGMVSLLRVDTRSGLRGAKRALCPPEAFVRELAQFSVQCHG